MGSIVHPVPPVPHGAKISQCDTPWPTIDPPPADIVFEWACILFIEVVSNPDLSDDLILRTFDKVFSPPERDRARRTIARFLAPAGGGHN